jgi:hypothetical protein
MSPDEQAELIQEVLDDLPDNMEGDMVSALLATIADGYSNTEQDSITFLLQALGMVFACSKFDQNRNRHYDA